MPFIDFSLTLPKVEEMYSRSEDRIKLQDKLNTKIILFVDIIVFYPDSYRESYGIAMLSDQPEKLGDKINFSLF